MWTAKLVYKNFEGGKLVVGIEYTNGTEVIREDAVISDSTQTAKSVAANKIAQLTVLENHAKNLVIGNLDTTVVPAKPTIEQQKKIDYSNKLIELRKKIDLVNLGVVTAVEAGIDTLKAELKQLATDSGII